MRSRTFVESLESRAMLAGDVDVAFARGGLVLRGDDLGNHVAIEADGATGGVRVTGLDDTTLNGQAGPLTFAAPGGDLRAGLGDGDDRLDVTGLTVVRNVSVDAGRGADAVTLNSVHVGAGLSIKGKSPGAKTMELRSVTVAGAAKVASGQDADALTVADSTFDRTLSLSTSRGDDALTLDGSRLSKDLRLSAGPAGRKTVSVTWTDVAGRAALSTGRDGDALSVTGGSFGKKASLRTGAGDDEITLAAGFAAGRSISDGAGDDALMQGVYRGFDFRNGGEGWIAGFADYNPEFNFFDSGLMPLPQELGVRGTGFMLRGSNVSDDLFMFLKRRLTSEDGVIPRQAYEVRYTISFASNAPTGADGVGGSPGESVFLKAGAASGEPVTMLDQLGYVRMNVDKGAQSNSGSAASVIGGIGNGISAEDNPPGETPYKSLVRRHVHRTVVSANANGEFWLLVGTDSGFEGATVLYYESIQVALVPVLMPAP